MTSSIYSQPESAALPAWKKWTRAAREEFGGLSPRVWLAHALPACLPPGMGGRLRAALYRLLGVPVGPGALVMGPLTLAGGPGFHRRVRLGARCFVNRQVYLDASAPVTLGDGVSLGHHVVIITTDHAVGPPEFRAGAIRTAPVTIEDGVWVAAGVTILPGVTIGRGAVVAAGAVVTKDVAPDTLVGGIPARLIRKIEGRP